MMRNGNKLISAGVLAVLCVAIIPALSARADEFHFDGAAPAEFYSTKSYESAYGSTYVYGGVNAVDSVFPELPFGVVSNTLMGAMERTPLYGWKPTYTPDGPSVSYGFSEVQPGEIHTTAEPMPAIPGGSQTVYRQTAYTSTAGMVQSDGSIGTLKIPSLNISMRVWEGETNESMSKGLGHYASTSGWDGNVALCGHNRGAQYVIGPIKDLREGDTITYQTVYGTRTYAVTHAGIISNTDWSYMEPSSDNRITLTTCLADQPDYRVCVQASEKIF